MPSPAGVAGGGARGVSTASAGAGVAAAPAAGLAAVAIRDGAAETAAADVAGAPAPLPLRAPPEGVAAPALPVPSSMRKAAIRSSVISKPSRGSGAQARSRRPLTAIW